MRVNVQALSYEGFGGVAVWGGGGAAWQCGGRGRGAGPGRRGGIPAGAGGPRGNPWAGTAFPEALTVEEERKSQS